MKTKSNITNKNQQEKQTDKQSINKKT